MSEQTLSLNSLCKVNGFTSQKNKNAYALYEMGQTFAVQSVTSLNRRELNHIEDIAALFLDSNQETDQVVIRSTPFFGGKSSQAIEAFP